MSRIEEDVTIETLLKDIVERMEKLEVHLVRYQDKVERTLVDRFSP